MAHLSRSRSRWLVPEGLSEYRVSGSRFLWFLPGGLLVPLASAAAATTSAPPPAPAISAIGWILGFGILGLLLADNWRLRRARRRAQAALQTRGELLATMSHEIRTPLNGILGLSQVLLQTPAPEEARECLATIHDSTDSLIRLLNDVLDWSRVEAGELELEQSLVPVRATMESVAALVRARAAEKGLEVRIVLESGTPAAVIGDPLRVRQILLNLAANAVKFTERGEILLQCGPQAPGVEFSVKDTGIGIPADRLPALFRRFSQADPSHGSRFGGAGLGLAITRHLVNRMGGSIHVSSEPGRGSEFRVKLPLPAAHLPPEPVMEARREARPRRNLRCCLALVVDDNGVNRRVAEKLLENLGLPAVGAASGEEALRVLQQQRFDLVLMDCKMPGLDGLETTRRLRSSDGFNRAVPVIAVTASVFEEDQRLALAAGMNDFLAKPVRLALLAAILDRWLGPRIGVAASEGTSISR